MEQFKPGIYIARDSKKVKYGGEDGGSWLSKYSFVEPEDFENVASKLKSGKTGDRPIYTKLKASHKEIWNSIQKNFGIKEEEFSFTGVIEIQEEVRIPQEDQELILEKGDRIKVLKEIKEVEMKDIIEIQEEVVIDQNDRKVILEKGDRIEVLKEKVNLSSSLPYEVFDAFENFIIDKTNEMLENWTNEFDELLSGKGKKFTLDSKGLKTIDRWNSYVVQMILKEL